MLALNQTRIDYFSLDVEGFELHILKTIPFDVIDIAVLTVEYLHGDKDAIKKLMKEKGYHLNETLAYSKVEMKQYSYDYVFVRLDLIH